MSSVPPIPISRNELFRKALPHIELRWAYLSETGLALKGFNLLPESAFTTLHNSHHTHFKKQSLYRLFTEKKRFLSGNKWLSLHHPWSTGYHHWLLEVLLKILTLENYQTYDLLIPADSPAFVFESLQAFAFNSILEIPIHTGFWVQNLHLIGNPRSGFYNPKHLLALRSHLTAFAQNIKTQSAPASRIYISRKNAQSRKLLNENAILPILKEAGFLCLECETRSFWDQVQLFQNCEYLIGMHGAGLSNALFMPPSSTVIEIIPDAKMPNSYNNCYQNLCWALNLKYNAVFGSPQDEQTTDSIYQSDLFVNPSSLLNFLAQIFS